MQIISNKLFSDHDTGTHPESKKRFESFTGLVDSKIINGEKFLKLIHTDTYIDKIKALCAVGGHLDSDTIVSAKSYEVACYAVGATIMAAEQQDFALVRPPGHHAHPHQGSGFCIFNNVAIATKYLLNQGKRVLIFDFDGHLGDGTEKIFYADNNVLYWSFHQYPAFPGWGCEEQIGEGRGSGYTINVPLPPKTGDDLFLKGFSSLIKIAEQFEPDVVAVSAGFDAHYSDLILDLRLSANVYWHIGKTLRKKFSRIFATLEGGYNIDMLPNCLYNFLNGINGRDIYYNEKSTESQQSVTDEFDLRMGALEMNLRKFWSL